MLGSTLVVVCFILNTLFLLFLAKVPLIASAAPIKSHFNHEKHHSYSAFTFLITVDFLLLISRF